MRDHGMTPDRFYWHERVGYNYRMTNLQASLGVAQLGRVQEILSRNAGLEKLYREHFRDLPGISFAPGRSAEYEPVVWLVCALVPERQRERLFAAAGQAGIELRPFFHPLSAMPAYAAHARPCPASERLSRTGLNLPTSSAVDQPAIERIGRVFREVLA
jgi:perosamine synthetase